MGTGAPYLASQTSDKDLMEAYVFPYHQIYEAERRKTPAEEREADALSGEVAASLHALFALATEPSRVLRQLGRWALDRILTKDRALIRDRQQWPECAGGRVAD